jgi:hypothetical protein
VRYPCILPRLCRPPLVVTDCDDDEALEEAERRVFFNHASAAPASLIGFEMAA